MTKKSEEIIVSIRCTVFNHENYLRQCLDGIVSQKTNFKYEAIVHDDASSDGSADIIREYAEKYPSIVKPIYQKENQFSKDIAIVRETVTKACSGKYMAWCEGDDYWIDPFKLQKQVAILENDHTIGLVYGKAKQFLDKKKSFKKQSYGSIVESAKDLIFSNTIPTPTVMVRKSLYTQYMNELDIQSQKWLMGDYPLWIYLAVHSRLYFINDDLAVYRILEESACHSNNRFKLERFYLSAINMKRFLNSKYNIVDDNFLDNQKNELLLMNAAVFGDYQEVIRLYSVLYDPQPIVVFFYKLARYRLLFVYNLYRKIFV